MRAAESKGIAPVRCSVAAACLGALAVLGAYAASVWPLHGSAAEEPAQVLALTAPQSLADLEKAFWSCDYTATAAGVSAAPIELCSTITEDLKIRKFDGDYDEMVKWWRENKIAAHRHLAEQKRNVADEAPREKLPAVFPGRSI